MRTVYPKRLDRRVILSAVDWPDFWADELPGVVFKRNHGWQCGGCNPLRADANPGSFRVNLSHGGFIDYADNTKGDAIAWIQRRYALTFREALEVLEGYTL